MNFAFNYKSSNHNSSSVCVTCTINIDTKATQMNNQIKICLHIIAILLQFASHRQKPEISRDQSSFTKWTNMRETSHFAWQNISDHSNLVCGTCPVTKRRPWRSTFPGIRRSIWRRISSVEPHWWMTWGWSWWALWWHREPPWLVLRCGSARNSPTKWWRSDQMECRSGWGSSPWNERTESRKPAESNFLMMTQELNYNN